MSKIMYVDNNPFEVGMTFKTIPSVAEFFNNWEVSGTDPSAGKRVLNHCCEWHKDKDTKIIYIDKVFDEVKPFLKKGFRYEVGQEIETKQGKVLVLDRYIAKDEHRNNENRDTNACYYKCKCLIDGYEFEIQESYLNSGAGCPLCGKNTVIPGLRSLYDFFPEVVKYLKFPEQAKEYLPYSTKRIMCKCPNCGAEKPLIISYLAQHGFACTVCSDNISYPNKFIREMLNQLDIDYVPEKVFDWSEKKQYDQYVECHNMIIENHGKQHYEEVEGSVFGTLAEQQENDKIKYNLAINNGVSKYIALDCRLSEADWIKKSVMESELPVLLNFTEDDVDWEKCDVAAQSNAEMKKICEAYKTNKNISALADEFKHSHRFVRKTLELGAKCGYCDYEKNNNEKNGMLIKGQSKKKPIYCITDDIYFMDQHYCEIYYKCIGLDYKGEKINKNINKSKPYKGKHFEFISRKQFNNKFDESQTNDSVKVVGERFLERYVKEDK